MRDAASRCTLRSPDTYVPLAVADCHQPIHRRFEQHAAQQPAATAIRLDSGDVTYAQLNAEANRAARALLAMPDMAGRPVALLMPQGHQSIVWTLAILKAGLAYAPLDQRLPVPVLGDMLDDLAPAALLVAHRHRDLGRQIGATRCPVVDVDNAVGDDARSAGNVERLVAPADLACVFYTSGSTGRPKGVADSHRNVMHNVLRYTNTLRFAPGDLLSLVQNPSFSGTVSSLFGALLNGAAVVPFDLIGDGLPLLSAAMRRASVTVFHAVPAIFRELSDPRDRFPAIRLVRLEGDRAMARDIGHFRANFREDCTLVNGLGATECGLVRQFFVGRDTDLDAAGAVPLGYPVPDVAVRILDEDGRAVAAEAPGEIVVESRFLAAGYWRNPELTAQRFEVLADGVRRYRTGDRGRLQPDGCLLHLGRIDHRVRIAGEFVETGEVERLLQSIAGIAQAVVHDYADRTNERRLCAYLVRDPAGSMATAEQLRETLAASIGPRAVPTRFMFLDALPLTKDLKVDRGRLPQPAGDRPDLPNDYVAPATALERQMAQVWSEVLQIDPVGVTDSLFSLGGDSLGAARILNRLTPICGNAISMTSLFELPTIRALAGWVERDQAISRPAPAPLAGGPDHSIAVIGMACRFPGADSLDQFWANLRSGRETITFFDPGELDGDGGSAPGRVPARGLLAGVDRFDARHFRLSPRQAQMLDPQQRVWLECVHRAMEDAGLPVGGPAEPAPVDIGVFAGGRESTYLWHLVGGNRQAVEALLSGDAEDALELRNGNDRDSIATRTSYLFGFTGPSINVQTACSTSLVAVAQACQALANRQCDVAIAGGVAVTFPQQRGHRHQAGSIYSSDGHCRPFDADASGTVFSDGVGAVVLKRLDRAQADGDRIDGVILGWAVNNDGAHKASFAAPSVQGQARVIAQAQDHAAVRPHEISYVEAHGTGTPVGDPIEFAAFGRAFRRDADGRGFCGLGSVKSNIGHTDTAAGIAGLIKTMLALKHRELPPTLHYRRPHPGIDVAASPFYVVDRLRPWTPVGDRRIAGVSSLGVGGTNCHVIVSEAPTQSQADAAASPACLVPLSAASPDALDAVLASYREFLSEPSCPDVARIAATAQRNRAHHAVRTAIRCGSGEQMLAALSGDHAHEVAGAARTALPSVPRRWSGRVERPGGPSIGFLFAGQGSQHAGMGRALFDASPEFRRLLQDCERLLRGHMDRPLLEVMFDDAGGDVVQQTEFAQPALFALEYSLAGLLRTWGITPRFVIGHSVGEYVAACVAGVFTLEEGLMLAASRGRLMQRLARAGAMRAVAAGRDAIEPLLAPFADRVSIAAVNAPAQTVLSGDREALDQLGADLSSRGIGSRALAVSHAFHSAQMIPVLQPLAELFGRVRLQPPAVRFISNLTGRAATDEVTVPGYWTAHTREPVLFAAGIETLGQEGCETLVEIGPDGMLSHLIPGGASGRRMDSVATLRRGEHDWDAMLETLARLYVRGVPVDWRAFQAGRTTPPVRLPTYPFQRTRHWYQGPLVSTGAGASPSLAARRHPLLGHRLDLPGSEEVRFAARFSQTTPQFLTDHRLFGVSLPPAASHLSMLAQAATVLAASGPPAAPLRFEALRLLRPLLLPEGVERDVQLICRPVPEGWSVELTSAEVRDDGPTASEWTTHMIGRGPASAAGPQSAADAWDLDAIRAACHRRVSGAEFYANVWANQGGTGSSFRWIESIWQGDRVALCRAVCPAGIADRSAYRLHPGLIESACQVLHCCGAIETAERLEAAGVTYIPFSVDAFTLHDVTASHDEMWCHARLHELTNESVVADLTILTASGEVAAMLRGFCLRPITRDAVVGAAAAPGGQRRERRAEWAPADRAAATRWAPGLDETIASNPRAPSREAVEQRLVEIWQTSLQVAPIAITDDFFALGGDSLTAVGVFSRIEAVFGKSLSIATLFHSPTIAALADRVLERFDVGERSSLVEIQRGDGGKMPIVCVHGGGGTVVGFRELTQHLGASQPVYGLEARGLYDDQPPDTTIEEMAARYVAAIRAAWPRGPYALAGFSFGGVVAFEMARQLTASGASVSLLALLDAPALGADRRLPISARLRKTGVLLWRRMAFHARNLDPRRGRETLDYLAGRARTLSRRARSRLWQAQRGVYSALDRLRSTGAAGRANALPDRFRNVKECLTLAARRYTPGPYAGAATLFRAGDAPAIFLIDPALGWGGLVEHLEVREVPGDHVTMLEEPHVRRLAAELESCLDEARRTAAVTR